MYEVFALKYGERDTTKCQFFYRESSHEKFTLDYFVWLILGGPHPLLVDTGFLDDDSSARGSRPATFPFRSSLTFTTTTGPGTVCSRMRSSGSRGRKWRSGRGPSAGPRHF